MRVARAAVFTLLSVAAIAVSVTAARTIVSRPVAFAAIEGEYGDNDVVDGYVLSLPRTYAETETDYPVLVHLQGGLGVGGDVIDLAQWNIPRVLREERDMNTEFHQLLLDEFVVISVHMAEDDQFYRHADAFEEILDELSARYRVDEHRVYLTGLSRGGHGTWGLATRIPERFAAVVPIAGSLSGVTEVEALRDMPIWIAHNRGDTVTPFEPVFELSRDIEQLGGDPFFFIGSPDPSGWDYLGRMRVFTAPELDVHDAWTEMYTRPDMLKWMLQHCRDGGHSGP